MKLIIISILVAVGLIAGTVIFTRGEVKDGVGGNNVSIVDGKQIIKIRTKGGYQPQKSIAQANVPTILRFDTIATFDCSSAVLIPSLGVRKNLPQTGSTDIDLGSPEAGKLQGMCSMGMYQFVIEFQG